MEMITVIFHVVGSTYKKKPSSNLVSKCFCVIWVHRWNVAYITQVMTFSQFKPYIYIGLFIKAVDSKHSLWFTLILLCLSFFFRYPQSTKLYFERSLPYVYWARGNFKGALQAFVDLYKGPSATGIYSNKPVKYVTWLLTTFLDLSVIFKVSCYMYA